MATPQIAVRLSADGVQDVVNAMRRVRQEGVETAGILSQAWEQMAELAPVIGIGVAVEKMVELIGKTQEETEELGKLAEKTGANVGTLSALSLAANDVALSQEDLSKAMIKLAKNQEQATDGSAAQKKAFADLGISMKDLRTKDPGAIFVQMAQKMAEVGGGSKKIDLAWTLLGKSGANLIPLLNKIGEAGGYDEAVEKAKKYGLFLDKDMVDAAKVAAEAMHNLQSEAKGLAVQFDAGFMPRAAQALKTYGDSVAGTGVGGVKAVGDAAGRVVQVIVAVFQTGALAISEILGLVRASFLLVWDSVKSLGEFANTVFQNQSNPLAWVGAFKNAKIQLSEAGRDFKSNLQGTNDEVTQSMQNTWKHVFDKAKPEDTTPPPPGGTGNGKSEEEKRKAEKAYSAYLQARADNELSFQKLNDSLQEAEDKRHYEAGLLSLDDYYDLRKASIEAAADQEAAALTRKRADAEKLPEDTDEDKYKRQQELDKIQEQALETQMKNTAALAANEDERSKAKHDAALKEMQDTEKLQQMSGDKYGAEETALKIELQQYEELLKKQGMADADIAARVGQYKNQGQAKIEFGRYSSAGSQETADLTSQISAVQTQADTGQITQLAATAKILDLEQKRLPLLRQIGAEMMQNALESGDETLIAQAKQYNANLDDMAAKMKNLTSAATELENQLSTQGYDSLVTFFSDGISGAKSFGDAMGDLANTFEKMVSKMIAQLITFYLLEELVGWIAPNSSFAKSLSSSGPFGKGFAGGGYTGDAPTDAAVGVVHGQEWVFDAATTKANRSLFQSIQDGQTPAIRSVGSASQSTAAYVAENSGPVEGAGGPSVKIEITNNSGQPVTQKQGKTPDGGDLLQIIIGKVADDIGRGGQVARSMELNYGVSRQARRIS